ncbi:MAG: hypothetical protein Q7T34_00650 [Candidatus Parcubacteria bacterium]|nr:hypothetical protein [Candidatus Parcubacteria bacterium]
MEFEGDIHVKLGDIFLTEKILETFRQKWTGKVIVPTIDHQKYTDLEALIAFMLYEIPLIIISDKKKGRLILETEIKRFPYSIGKNETFAAWGIRMIPILGSIKAITASRLNIPFKVFGTSQYGIVIDLGNTTLHLEINYFPNDKKISFEVTPPAEFLLKKESKEIIPLL